MATPKELGYRMPAEFEPQEAIWLSWPHNKDTFSDIEAVKKTYIEFVKALHKDQKVNILVNDKVRVSDILKDINNVFLHEIKTADVWIRDYGPIFVTGRNRLAMLDFIYNAWGDKYDDLKQDNNIPKKINRLLDLEIIEPDFVLEGGSIDVNGSGLLLTTGQCLLNKNRNPVLNKEQIEQHLKDYLNVSHILWLKEGIAGDDTDGHIDDIARFVNKDTIVCAYEEDKDDENYEILKENHELLQEIAKQRSLRIIKLPMPGTVEKDGARLPASYLNFYIGNKTVCVPIFSHKNDQIALDKLQSVFPGRKVLGIDCTALVEGLGALHCVSQQQPKI